MDKLDLASIRRDYALRELSEETADPDPFTQFAAWVGEARKGEAAEFTAMTLSTVDNHGQPSARTVLLKDFDASGFVFFTNYGSKKALDMAGNDRVSLHLFWRELERQVAIAGRAMKVSREESEAYFSTRPRASQIGAWASRQSEVLPGRTALEERVAEIEAEFDGRDVPCPDFWGGYRVVPSSIEFWQGRTSRLHDRIMYRREGEMWTIVRLSP